MEAILIVIGVVIGWLTLLTGVKAEQLHRRYRARKHEERTVTITDELRRKGWSPPSFDVSSSPFPEEWGWSGDVPDHAKVGRTRIGF